MAQRLLALHKCPGCGIEIQRGRGPHGLAQHRCNPELTVDTVTQVALRRAMQMLEDPTLSVEQFQRVAKAVAGLRVQTPRPPGRPPMEKAATPAEAAAKEQDRVLRMLNSQPTLDD